MSPTTAMNEVTIILEDLAQGKEGSAERLLPLVYEELRKLARARMAKESPGQTLQATALVHEAYIKLVKHEEQTWQNRGHFFASAAEAMRRILVDRARRKMAQRRGARVEHVDLDHVELSDEKEDQRILEINEALEEFSRLDAKKAELIKMRFFVGLTTEAAAEVLGISLPTANRWWTYGKAWIFRYMAGASPEE